MLSIGVRVLQQASGVNMATYYVGTIFTVLQFDGNKGGLATGGLGLVGFVACIASCFLLMEQFGRVRTLMLGSFLQPLLDHLQQFLRFRIRRDDVLLGGVS